MAELRCQGKCLAHQAALAARAIRHLYALKLRVAEESQAKADGGESGRSGRKGGYFSVLRCFNLGSA